MYGYGSVHSFVARPQTRPSPLPVLFRCSIPVCLMRGDGGRGDVFAASSRHLQSCLVGVSPPPHLGTVVLVVFSPRPLKMTDGVPSPGDKFVAPPSLSRHPHSHRHHSADPQHSSL